MSAVDATHPREKKYRKLCAESVAELFALYQAGRSMSQCARDYNVSPQTANYHIRRMKRPVCLYATALVAATEARRKGKLIEAAEQLRNAAKCLEQTAA